MGWITIYAIITTCFWSLLAAYLCVNRKNVRYLRDIPQSISEPSVVIVIAVRNEEASIEAALRSVCNLKYSNYSIVVVNDRSTDQTAAMYVR
jgi:cellulose synthase/poly-beta-1,6-N-acetylglucosamine synthase-like glycosyltransferase